jgi:hypothetical protein
MKLQPQVQKVVEEVRVPQSSGAWDVVKMRASLALALVLGLARGLELCVFSMLLGAGPTKQLR